ncbi:MAG: prepilin-type N-terminal cleavage/methylation domain-containing protein, partial [Planctomycetales bacterium]|nr:prepilin-type N-terminal cleavage/methylation domain-containing protein [Planctomycetales bacterium]
MRTDRIGYTMIETVIVMLVMGILAAVIAPKYRATAARYRVEAAARRLVADLSYVRTRAMMKGPVAEECVVFYAATEEYEISNAADLDHPDLQYRVDFRKTPYAVDIQSSLFQGARGAIS